MRIATAETLIYWAIKGAHGRNWYKTAQQQIEEEARLNGWNAGIFADVLAITSPRVSVSRNWHIAREYMKHGKVDGVLPNVVRSLRHYESGQGIAGVKTKPFAEALQGRENALVLDVWMARVLRVPQEYVRTIGCLNKVRPRFEKVAKVLGWSVSQVQAAVWTGYIEHNTRRKVAGGF